MNTFEYTVRWVNRYYFLEYERRDLEDTTYISQTNKDGTNINPSMESEMVFSLRGHTNHLTLFDMGFF